jgi:hypothetical protein
VKNGQCRNAGAHTLGVMRSRFGSQRPHWRSRTRGISCTSKLAYERGIVSVERQLCLSHGGLLVPVVPTIATLAMSQTRTVLQALRKCSARRRPHLDVEALRIQDAPAVQHHGLPRFGRLDGEADVVPTLALCCRSLQSTPCRRCRAAPSGQPLRVKACPLRSPLPLSAERRLFASVTVLCPHHQSMLTPRRSKPTSFNAMRLAYTPSRSTPPEPIFLEARVRRAGASKWPSGSGFMSRCLRLLPLNPSCAASAPGATTFGVKASPTAPHSRAEWRDLSAN